MARQLRHLSRPRALQAVLTAAAALWVGCSGEEATPGIHFEPQAVDLGRFHAGETIPVEFPFEVHGEQVLIERFEELCGCLEPRVLVNGEPLAPRPPEEGGGWLLEAGTEGAVVVDYATAGYRGRKRTGVVVHGRGAGLPAPLGIDSWLDGWFETSPQIARFGAVDGREDHVVEVTVTGEQPFRVTELIGGAAPLQVQGLPSAAPSTQQTLRILLPARPEESGRHVSFLNFGTDVGRSFRMAVEWEWAPEVQIQPWPRLMLRGLDPAAETWAVAQVAVRSGVLEGLEVNLEGPEGSTAELMEEVAGAGYRVKLMLPAGLPSGPVRASLRFTGLHRRADGTTEPLDRTLPILGIVPEAESP